MMVRLLELKQNIDRHKYREALYLIPIVLCCALFYFQSLSFHIHDYGVSYFPAQMVVENIPPESKVFDIYEFNEYIWAQGYRNERSDFYLNSPFLSTIFYPLALIGDVYLSKALFNGISIVFFLFALHKLAKRYLKEESFLLALLPILLLMPIRNHILFGQNYMLIFALVTLSFLAFERNKNFHGGSLISIAILAKVFPVFYILPLAIQRNWKALYLTAFIGLLMIIVSWFVSGSNFWQEYLFDVLPGALASESTTDFRPNAQSIDVFFRTLFVRDIYYNPRAFVHNPQLYKILVGFCKAIVLGFTIRASIRYKKNLFRLLAIWVVALFLMQTRTASYAQILWIIPLIEVFRSGVRMRIRILFLALILLIGNFPYPMLISAPTLITFSRLWLTLTLAILFWYQMKVKFNLRFVGVGLLIMLPLTVKSATKRQVEEPGSSYVLAKKSHFMIYDFNEVNGQLNFNAIGNMGDTEETVAVAINSFDTEACSILDGQIFLGVQQLTYGPSLKKKPVLINGCEVFYLSDHLSRLGAFTLKKINVCKLEAKP